MDLPNPHGQTGRVASLHLHPDQAGAPMRRVNHFEAVAESGIRENRRYFGRRSQSTGLPSIRQVSLIEREQLSEHATALGLPGIAPGAARANIETNGINLVALAGREIKIGEAILRIRETRTPCHKMDLVAPGLRTRMEDDKQGVLAEVVQGGQIAENDLICAL